MRAEFSIYPMPVDSSNKAPAVEALPAGGPNARLGPLSTVVEGNWNEVLTTIQRCHQAVAHTHERVITKIVIDDQHPRRKES